MREKKKDKTAWKCQVQKGSMTVEAAFVMPLVLLVVFALLLLTMFVHNRAWYTAVCAETAISASTAGIRSRQEAQEMAAEKMSRQKGEQGFPVGSLSMTAATGEDYVKTHAGIRSGGVMGIGLWDAQIEEKSSFVRPVSFIRSLMALEEWGQEKNEGWL